ncbi:ATP-binding cassette sub-family C member 11-like, partial [Uranotaenia lowii]|uniref:ATP-binding cassette sub-family C member 11-like n=1 Tax=Uranotaenia lowii TaxID=190385 RepID=UPI0024785D26
FYNNVEENSTAVFLCQSIRLFGDYWFRFLAQSVGLAALLLILLLTPNSDLSIHRYVLAIFGYISFVHGLSKCLNSILTIETSNSKLNSLRNQIADLEVIEEPQTVSGLTNSNIGISISFRDVVFQLAHRKLLNISKMEIRAGETVAITGQGSTLLVPLLHRIISPSRGSIRLNQLNLSQIDCAQIKKQIYVVPGNPQAAGLTVEQFLNPDAGYRVEQINDALKEVKLFEAVTKLPNKMDSFVDRLPRPDRQLLALARCFLANPSVIVIEHPAPAIMDTVNWAIRKKFAEQTVLVICTHQCQYEKSCERQINLSELRAGGR